MMKMFFSFIIIIHGLIHLMGFAKAFNLADISQLTQSVSKISGMLWLISSVLFLITFVLLLFKNNFWWILAIVAIVLSQVLIIQSWHDAKFGTLANFIILVPIIISFMNALPSSFQNRYKTEAQKRLTPISDVFA